MTQERLHHSEYPHIAFQKSGASGTAEPGRAWHYGTVQEPVGLPNCTVQQALRVQWRVFGVFVCFDLYFVNYRSWQAEILQEGAEGCIQVDLQKKIRQDKNKAEVTYLIVSQALSRHYLRPRRRYLFWVKGHSGASRQLLKTLVYL